MKQKLKIKLKIQKGCCSKDLLFSIENSKGQRVAVCQICRKAYVRNIEKE
jgi:hypothetical protein